MAVRNINHFNIRPLDLEQTKDFYVSAIGLVEGYRPPFGFPGYWLYADGFPILHLLGPRAHEDGIDVFECADERQTGYLDHIALSASDLTATKRRLEGLGIPFREQVVPSANQTQLFMFDPSGVQIELVFPADETAHP